MARTEGAANRNAAFEKKSILIRCFKKYHITLKYFCSTVCQLEVIKMFKLKLLGMAKNHLEIIEV